MKKAIILLPIALFILLPSIALALPNPNNTGLTAKVIATKGQIITGIVDATGFDIGVYVGPGITGVIITKATITGANDHGIFIEDTSNVIVQNSIISGNGISPHGGIPEDKAITLSGTTNCIVKDNNVSFNLNDGGIAVTDDGAFDPAAPNPGLSRPGRGNIIVGNLVQDNLIGCGIIVAAYNPGQGVSDNIVMNNMVIGNSPGPFPPYIGGIVIAADMPSTTATYNLVLKNTVKGGWIPGIIVHSNAPGDFVSGTIIVGNTLDSNGAFPPSEPNDAQKPTGINIVAETPTSVLTNTLVIGNVVTSDYYGVWHVHDTDTLIIGLKGNTVVPIAP